jgi:uncharacterized membrane protein HdeD (DUF308 family)
MTADRSDRSPRSPEVGLNGQRGWLSGYVWWIFAATGACLLILGLSTLAMSPESVVTLAKITGITLIADALLLALLAGQAQEWGGFYLLGAVTGIAGLVLVTFGERETLRLALVLGSVLLLRGVVDLLVAWTEVSDFTEAGRTLWAWILLGVGIVSFVLGVVALITKGTSTFVLLLIVGCLALARGIGLLGIASRLRALT